MKNYRLSGILHENRLFNALNYRNHTIYTALTVKWSREWVLPPLTHLYERCVYADSPGKKWSRKGVTLPRFYFTKVA